MDKPINPVKSLVSMNNQQFAERYVVLDTGCTVQCVNLLQESKYINGKAYAVSTWNYFKPLPAKRPMTHAEIFNALNIGAVIRHGDTKNAKNNWNESNVMDNYQICYNYTGTDDKWEKLETKD